MLRKIDRVILRVPNLQSAVRYYRDVLGLALLHEDKRVASFRLSEGATELVLHCDADLPAEAVYYLVDDVRDLYRRREQLQLVFIAAPTPVSRGFRAVVRDPFGNVLMLLDRTAGESAAIEDAKIPGALFAGVEPHLPTKKDLLIQLYEKAGRTADDLPYTPHFETLYSAYAAASQPQPTRREVWRQLLNLRKGGKLPKLGEARSEPVEATPEMVAQLKTLVGPAMGRRDRLPYTERFENLVDEFNKTQTRPLSPHLVWRLLAKLAK